MSNRTVDHHNEQDSLVSRIERLEAQNRRLKRGGLVCLLAFTSIALMAQAPRKTTRPPAPAKAPAPAAVAPALPKNIEAESFILKDATGLVRAELSMGGTGPSLKLRDTTGAALITLALNDAEPGGPFVLLSDPQHHAALSMSVLGGAGSQLTMTGSRPDIQAHIGVTPDGTTLDLSDQDGFAASIGNVVQPAKGGQVKKTQAASIALFNKDRKLLWSAP